MAFRVEVNRSRRLPGTVEVDDHEIVVLRPRIVDGTILPHDDLSVQLGLERESALPRPERRIPSPGRSGPLAQKELYRCKGPNHRLCGQL